MLGRKMSVALMMGVLSGIIWSAQVFAGVVFEEIAASGTGCRLESLHGAITNEGAVLYFSDLNLESEVGGARIQRTNCNLAIPVKVPAHKKLVFEKISISGVTYLGMASKATVSTEAFLAGGESGGRESQEIVEEGISFINLGDRPRIETSCGNDSILRVSASAVLRPGEDYNLVYISRLKMKYSLEDC